jgi:hypothetical protein
MNATPKGCTIAATLLGAFALSPPRAASARSRIWNLFLLS